MSFRKPLFFRLCTFSFIVCNSHLLAFFQIQHEAVVVNSFRFSSDRSAAFAGELDGFGDRFAGDNHGAVEDFSELTFQKTGMQSVIPAVEFLARIKYLLTQRTFLSHYEGFFYESFDASQGAQKRTASDKYFCSSPELLSKTSP
jgi:hypothetical protein